MKKVLLLVAVLIAVAIYLFTTKPSGDIAIVESPVFGINIGHWLSDELQFGEDRYRCDQPSAFELLQTQFGVAEADRLLDIYRDGFLRESDVAEARRLGFTSIRVPVSAALIYDKPGNSARVARVAARIEWLLKQAETNGLSVILNVSVRPGQWAIQPPVGGRRFAAVWSERDVVEAANAWKQLASRFRDAKALEGYDISPGRCQVGQDWNEALFAWSKAILSVDSNRVIYAPWPKSATRTLSTDPEFSGKKLGFAADFSTSRTNDPTYEEDQLIVEDDIPRMVDYWRQSGMRCLVSAYNPPDASWLGRYRDAFARAGWAHFLWTLKSLHSPGEKNGMGSLLTGEYGGVSLNDIAGKPSKETIETAFKSLGELNMSSNDVMVVSVIEQKIDSEKSKSVVKKSVSQSSPQLGEWTASSVGLVENEIKSHDGGLGISSSGLGPENVDPEFTFVHDSITGPMDINVVIKSADLVSPLAGAGLMVRERLDADSPYMLVYLSADGGIQAVANNRNNQPAIMRKIKNSHGSKYLRIIADGIVLKASCSVDGLTWPVAENFTTPWLTNTCLAGCAVFSGHEYRTAHAEFGGLKLHQLDMP